MITTHHNAQRHVVSVLLAALMIVIATAHASIAHAEAARLSADAVKRFIQSFPQVKAIVIQRGAENVAKATGDGNALNVIVEAATDKTLRTEIDAAVRPHNFRDTKEWLSTAQAVTRSYAYLKLSPSEDKTRRKLEKAIGKIEKNDFLDEKQKRKLIDALRGNLGAVTAPPPAEDMAAVKPSLAELDALVK